MLAIARRNWCHGAARCPALNAYLAEDLNLGRTAKRLYCHPKTVRYRLDRARDLRSEERRVGKEC